MKKALEAATSRAFAFFVINTLILFCLRALYHMRFFFAIYSVYFSVHKYHMAFSYYNQQYADTSLQFLTTQKENSTVAIHDWEFVVVLVVFFFLLYFPANGQFSGLHKSAIDAALLHELFVSTALDNFATVNDEDVVGVANGFQSMGNHDDGFLFGQCFNGIGQLLLAFRVNIGGCLVQNDNGCILHNGSGNGNALFFTAGKICAAFTDNGFIPIG